ncbi:MULTISPECIES: hypothetical protein [Actinosynnema]|uniref:hypothetical protein n=1 Tax=Actinosynnema TaxID=40566 RepID=UPI0020A2B10F|nr:hypothetical protein [Actinosynnema pretiosum]MCP2095050.1 hypothetical protein [Actinosynnema pretiosum]
MRRTEHGERPDRADRAPVRRPQDDQATPRPFVPGLSGPAEALAAQRNLGNRVLSGLVTGGAPVQRTPVQRALVEVDLALNFLKINASGENRYSDDFDEPLNDLQAALALRGVTTVDSTGNSLDSAATAVLAQYMALTNDHTSPTYRVVYYMLNGGVAPSTGGLGDLRVGGQALTGRPAFATGLKQTMPIAPMQARRHITAWHNISSFLTRAYQAQRQPLMSALQAAEANPSQRFAAYSGEVQNSLNQRPPQQFGNIPAAEAQLLMKAAYVANSTPANLWPGNSKENSQINVLSTQLRRLVATLRTTSPAGAAAFAQTWTGTLNGYQGLNRPKAQTAIQGVIARLGTLMSPNPPAPTAVASAIEGGEIRDLEVDQRPGNAHGQDIHQRIFEITQEKNPQNGPGPNSAVTPQDITDFVAFFLN